MAPTRGSLSFSRNVNHLHAPTALKNVDSTEPKSKRSGPRSQRNAAGAQVQSEHTDYKVWPHVHAGIESDHTWTEFDYKVTLTSLHKKLKFMAVNGVKDLRLSTKHTWIEKSIAEDRDWKLSIPYYGTRKHTGEIDNDRCTHICEAGWLKVRELGN